MFLSNCSANVSIKGHSTRSKTRMVEVRQSTVCVFPEVLRSGNTSLLKAPDNTEVALLEGHKCVAFLTRAEVSSSERPRPVISLGIAALRVLSAKEINTYQLYR